MSRRPHDARAVILVDGATAERARTMPEVGVRTQDLQALRWQDLPHHALRYSHSELVTHRIDVMAAPFKRALLLRFLSRGTCGWRDDAGAREELGVRRLGSLAWSAARDAVDQPLLVRRVEREVAALEALPGNERQRVDLRDQPVYLRTDLAFGLRAGGSVTHTAGVLNQLDEFARPALFLTPSHMPLVKPAVQVRLLEPGSRGWNTPACLALRFNETAESQVADAVAERRVAFVYQRYSIDSYLGVKIANRLGVPLVLEYNGSEVWVAGHWGGPPLSHKALTERIETLNLRRADMVVVVSERSRDEIVKRGIDPAKVLVNPNGVDPERYSPAVDGTAIRAKYGLGRKTVVGFIGTFGPWHGAEGLAEAFGRLLRRDPTYRDSLALLMIGDGTRMDRVRKRLSEAGVLDSCVLTGSVPQEEGARYLAACDILVSPHVPNPDGSRFFGSPTKLFEYMAMGKGIVASDLEQIGEVLEHDRTAWLVTPGDVDALADGLRLLVTDPERRRRLGESARREAVEKHTWREHTRRIIDKLRSCCDEAGACLP